MPKPGSKPKCAESRRIATRRATLPAPETARQIVLAGQTVAYQLRRSQRRSIGLRIDQRGLIVGAPPRARINDIEALLHKHRDWVLDKLADWRERPAPTTFTVHDGCRLFLLGAPLTVKLTSASRSRWHLAGDTLHLALPPTVDAQKALKTALQGLAREHFSQRLAALAPPLGVAAPPLRLSSARTRWGSCSRRDGKAQISLNWKLILLPPAIVDYVVIHELAHLHEMNHSHRFWSHVAAACPDWMQRRTALRQLAKDIPLL